MSVFLAFLGTFVDEFILGLLLLWLLPQFGIRLPLELTIGILAALAAWSALVYRPVRRAIKKEAPTPRQAMVGKKGAAVTQLAPEGLVRVQGETWSAVSSDEVIAAGERVVVQDVTGLQLTVGKGYQDQPQATETGFDTGDLEQLAARLKKTEEPKSAIGETNAV